MTYRMKIGILNKACKLKKVKFFTADIFIQGIGSFN